LGGIGMLGLLLTAAVLGYRGFANGCIATRLVGLLGRFRARGVVVVISGLIAI